LEDKKRVVDLLVANNVYSLVIPAMEPLIFPEVVDFFKYCRYSGVKISLTTNGTLINEAIASEVAKGGFKYVSISLEGFSEKTNDIVRGAGSFGKAIAGINTLVNKCNKNSLPMPIVIQVCINEINYEEILDSLDKFLLRYPTVTVSFGSVFGMGKAKKNPDLLLPRGKYVDIIQNILCRYPDCRDKILVKELTIFEKLFFNFKFDLNMPANPQNCHACIDRFSIMPDGNLCRCNLLLGSEVVPRELVILNRSIFDLPNVKIDDISEKYGILKKGFCLKCPFCNECNICMIYTKDRCVLPELVESCEKNYNEIINICNEIVSEKIKFKFKSDLKFLKRGRCIVICDRGGKKIEIISNGLIDISKVESGVQLNYCDFRIGEDLILKLLLNDLIRSSI
jgi:MoaA/NifB/PqqE/SkfB family radical SAM enzyme